MRFYTMKNKFTDGYNTPFPCDTDANAVYQVRIIVNQQREPAVIAEDYSLWFVGEFDSMTGSFIGDKTCLVEDCSSLLVKGKEQG